MIALLFLACHRSPTDAAGLVPDTADTGQRAPPPGVLLLAGGGSEGDPGDATAWSAALYGALLSNGDVTGDGRLRVAVVAAEEQTEWLPDYMVWLGEEAGWPTEAFNLVVATGEDADDAALDDTFQAVDAAFVKGGDQGLYYDLWQGTRLPSLLESVYTRGGGVGGTSAGAMALAGLALAGGKDLVSTDVLADACTPWLDDESDGGSAVHDDFIALAPLAGVVVDTHFTQRARLGRLVGALARVRDDLDPEGLLGVGVEQRTGLVLQDGEATVVGEGSVTFLQTDEADPPVRDCGEPLVWSGLVVDRLVEGWRWSLDARGVSALPDDAEAVRWSGPSEAVAGEWLVDGDWPAHEERFGWVVSRAPDAFDVREGTDPPLLGDATGITDAHDELRRSADDEALWAALRLHAGAVGFLVGEGTTLESQRALPERISSADNPLSDEPVLATLVIDTSDATWTGDSPHVSPYDAGDGTLRAAAFAGARLHVLHTSGADGPFYDTTTREVVEGGRTARNSARSMVRRPASTRCR